MVHIVNPQDAAVINSRTGDESRSDLTSRAHFLKVINVVASQIHRQGWADRGVRRDLPERRPGRRRARQRWALYADGAQLENEGGLPVEADDAMAQSAAHRPGTVCGDQQIAQQRRQAGKRFGAEMMPTDARRQKGTDEIPLESWCAIKSDAAKGCVPLR